MRNKVEALSSIPALRGLRRRDIELLSVECDELHFTPGRLLQAAGSLCNELLIVVEGALIDSRGSHFGPGAVVGEAAMWERGPVPVSIHTATRGRLLLMGHAQFRAWKAIVGRPAAQPEKAAGASAPKALAYRAANSAGV